MPSTSSSTDGGLHGSSATVSLASRYRHLFTLPSTTRIVLYVGVLSAALGLESGGPARPAAAVVSFAAAILTAALGSRILKSIDAGSPASFRRTLVVLAAGDTAWVAVTTLGVALEWASGSQRPLANATLFGASLCAGLEFIMVFAVFSKSLPLSLGVAFIYPFSTFALTTSLHALSPDYLSVASSALAFIAIACLALVLSRVKTSRGVGGISLFRAFMKTWAGGQPDDLEAIISAHSEKSDVVTRVIRLSTLPEETFIVLPEVHPGPFYPVGSYNLPGLVSRAMRGAGNCMTFHLPGGHERNLATSKQTADYASKVAEYAGTVGLSADGLRGPVSGSAGKAKLNSFGISNQTVMTVTFSPLGSDDLSLDVERQLTSYASDAGVELTVVDAHNSLGEEVESPDTADPEWVRLISQVRDAPAAPYRAGYSHSSELGSALKGDVTDNGVALLMLEKDGDKWVLVLADANNAVPSLRSSVATALDASGYKLLEFCTSDSHDLAAKGLTTPKGYYALGEITPMAAITRLVVELAKRADQRLAPARHGVGSFTFKAEVFGQKALEEFARSARAGSASGRKYLRICSAIVLVTLVSALLL